MSGEARVDGNGHVWLNEYAAFAVDTGAVYCERSDLPVSMCGHCRDIAEWNRQFKAEARQRGRDRDKPRLLGGWFAASYPGQCSRCNKPFEAGDEVRADWPREHGYIRRVCHETARPRKGAA